MNIIINVLTVSVLINLQGVDKLSQVFDKERAHDTFFGMLQTDRLHRSVVEDFLSVLGIHRSQHLTLLYLSKSENCPSQKAIAEHFKISPAAVTVTLKKLEEGGYILRSSVEKDSRYNSIALSEKGKEVVAQSRKLFEETDIAMFSEFTDEEYELFNRCINKMMDGLTKFRQNRNTNQL